MNKILKRHEIDLNQFLDHSFKTQISASASEDGFYKALHIVTDVITLEGFARPVSYFSVTVGNRVIWKTNLLEEAITVYNKYPEDEA